MIGVEKVRKSKIFTVVSIFAISLVVLSACNSSEQSTSRTDDQQQINDVSKESDNDSSKTTDSSTSSDNSTSIQKDENKQQASVEKPNNSNQQNSVSTEEKVENDISTKSDNTNNTDNDTSAVNDNPVNKNTNKQTDSNGIHISSGGEAIEYLKQQIPEGKNEDISFGAEETPRTDHLGSFYLVRLTSISMRLAGGTGTLDNYKVYEDGTIELY